MNFKIEEQIQPISDQRVALPVKSKIAIKKSCKKSNNMNKSFKLLLCSFIGFLGTFK